LNGERMLGNPCSLEVVKMKGWKRKINYAATKLKWVAASPHIPQAEIAPFYAISGIVGELDSLNIGVGYTLPFQVFGAPWMDADVLTARMNALHLPGYCFRPIYYAPFYSKFKGQQVQGVQVYITDYTRAQLCDVQFYVLQELYKLNPSHDILNESGNRTDMFNKVCGSKKIRELFLKHHQWSDVQPYWTKDVEAFKKLSKKYYLYK
jgi:hypothetical protein